MSKNQKLNIVKSLLLVLVVIYSASTHARRKSVLDVENFTGAPVPSTFFFGFDISADLKYGSLDSADSEVFEGASLTGMGVGAEAVLGWPIFFVGAGGDYSKLYQLQPTSDLEDKNASGTLMTTYALAGFYLVKWRFSFKYFVSSTYTFNQQTVGGKDFELSAPTGSFGVNVTVGGKEGRALSFEFNSLTYGEYTLGDAQREFGSSARPKVLTYGVVYAIRF